MTVLPTSSTYCAGVLAIVEPSMAPPMFSIFPSGPVKFRYDTPGGISAPAGTWLLLAMKSLIELALFMSAAIRPTPACWGEGPSAPRCGPAVR